MTLYCKDLAKEGLWDVKRCCSSCHSDDEEEYSHMMFKTLPDGRECYVCCACSLGLKLDGLTKKETKGLKPEDVRKALHKTLLKETDKILQEWKAGNCSLERAYDRMNELWGNEDGPS